MSRSIRASAQPILLSVLDRLISGNQLELDNRAESVRKHKDAVRRDLEWLLNTRQNADVDPSSRSEVNKSVYAYGLPDFSALSLSSGQDQLKLLKSVQEAIKVFEPRLSNVQVIPLTEERTPNALRFRIEA